MASRLKNFASILGLGIGLFGSADAQDLPFQTSTLFSGSGNCAVCHEPGFPNTSALLDPEGNDISPPTHWRSSMMANAAKDPLWQAKVSAEVSAHPGLQQIIEDKCTTCHSPLGRTEAIHNGADHYSLAQMQNDPLALDGVSCTSCHQIKDVGLGSMESFSGGYIIENDRLIYGPYPDPFANPMEMMVNYTPVFGEQVHESGLCATCHTLFTPTLDNDGEIVGEIPEQAPFLEWANSEFPGQDKQCQTCHMPEIEDPVVISNRPQWLSPRTPFAKHYFVGGNVFMLKILRDHRSAIGVTASAAQLDSTIARTMRLLQNETVELSATHRLVGTDTLDIDITVTNKAGHKFPTGFPSRRAWLHLKLSEVGGLSVFESGSWSSEDGEISGLDSPYEPHYGQISSEQQVQVYQALMQDVDGAVTYTLLRGADYIKDNRLPPAGFTSSGPFYEYTAAAGMAALDPNFNWSDGFEGSGRDTCRYRIGGVQAGTTYQLEVKLLYQTVTPRFIQDLFQYDTPEVQTFQSYYQNADKSPVCIDSLQVVLDLTAVSVEPSEVPNYSRLTSAYPNPFNPRNTITFSVSRTERIVISIFDLTGRRITELVDREFVPGDHSVAWAGLDDSGREVPSGNYIVRLETQEKSDSRKIALVR